MKKAMLAILIFWGIAYYYITNRPKPEPRFVAPPVQQRQTPAPPIVHEPVPAPPMPRQQVVIAPPTAKTVQARPANNKLALRYKIQNGMFIVQGDIVAGGVIPGQNPPEDGMVEMDPLNLWPNVIAYHIQPDVVNPGRILEAIRMFDGTAVQFVKQTDETDVMVFEQGEKNCLSYVGKVTAKQQIWISPLCAPDDIAHEILHALGFMHEQNRSDRDDYVQVYTENIEDEFQYNFEKLPPEFMKVSGLAEFDYQSLMMYPPTMFAKGGRNTMEPKQRDKLIDPQPRLSAGDIVRLNKAYGR